MSSKTRGGAAFIVRDVQFAGATTIIDAVDAKSGSVEMRVRQAPGSALSRLSIGKTVAFSWANDSITMVAGGRSDAA